MATLNIGLVSYHVVGPLVFVRVPSEKGRYMLTHMCVTVVPCPACDAVKGEPCRAGVVGNYWRRVQASQGTVRHLIGTHFARRNKADEIYGKNWTKRAMDHYKLHVEAGDIAAAMADPVDELETLQPVEVDVPVFRKKDGS